MKKSILTDVTISCEPPVKTFYFREPTLEDFAEYYEKWIKDFHEFIRDHRSQDPVKLHVEREYKDVCGLCNCDWETDENNCPVCCQKAVDEWNISNKPIT